ncbi:MAG TPA: hypothetical protein DIC57_03555 [Sphaerochaeta sp.]|nr:hypothetical protein [Sphaerochaeta sp.]
MLHFASSTRGLCGCTRYFPAASHHSVPNGHAGSGRENFTSCRTQQEILGVKDATKGAIDGIIDEVQLSSQMRLFIYGTFLYCTLYTAYNLVNIPYAALLPELTGDYNQRTTLSGYRMSFAVPGHS